MAINFNQYAAEANSFLKEYAEQIDLTEDPEKAARILSAVLHGLREIISVEESLQLISQFPMFLKAFYVNGWSINKTKTKVKHMPQFVDLVRSFDGVASNYDFVSDEIAEHYINTTFFVLRKYVSPGELQDIRDNLSKNLKNMI
jgi:uncharacterized protein (DUF2267 family)